MKRFKHPLLNDAKTLSEEDAAAMIARLFENRSKANKDTLVTGLLSVVRYNVGRYLHAFPTTRAYMDEMVSEGLLSIVKTVDGVTPEILDGRSIIKVASQRVVRDIENALYRLGTLVSPSKRTYERYGIDTPYPVAEGTLNGIDIEDNSSRLEQDLIDAEDALSVMATRLQLDADLMKDEYRYLTNEEAADALGVHHTTVSRHRAKLRSLYKVDFGG